MEDTTLEKTIQETPQESSFSITLLDTLQSFSLRTLAILLLLLGVALSLLTAVGIHTIKKHLVTVPAYGGTVREGIIGIPHAINPVLAASNADKNMTALVYSGLMRNVNGTLIPDLAENYTVSDDKLTYTFTLRDDAVFHDKVKVTADDVLFTIAMTQDPTIKSPHKIEWEGVQATRIDDRTIQFSLKKPFRNFLDNTTLGILPKHLWSDVTSDEFSLADYNTEPVGSGPYSVSAVTKVAGRPSIYYLSAFSHFTLGKPYIEKFEVHIYPNEKTMFDAFNAGTITNMSAITPEKANELHDASRVVIKRYPLPRVFAIFLNQNKATFLTSKNVRQALEMSIDRTALIEKGLYGFATPTTGPVPAGNQFATISTTTPDIAGAQALLEKDGWKKSSTTMMYEKSTKKETTKLQLTIATSDIDELKTIGGMVKDAWTALGVDTTVDVFEDSTLRQNVIKPRKYDALLYGNIVDQDSDLYAYWESSERTDPGLNIAQYTNSKVDAALETIKNTDDDTKRIASYKVFLDEIRNDVGAIFLYTPDFIYVTDSHIKGIETEELKNGADRFNDVYTWFIDTEQVWPVFKDIPIIKKLSELNS